LGRFLQTDPVGGQDDLNLYAYTYNDPLNRTDPTGNLGFADDAIGAGVGGLIGLSIQGWKDIFSLATGGDGGTWGESAGAFTTGAIAGVAAVNVPETAGLSSVAVTSGAASGAGNLIEQKIDKGEVDVGEVGTHTALGAVFGPIASKLLPGLRIKGISSGRNSAKAVGDAVKTKIENGVAASMSATTAAKAAPGTSTHDAIRSTASDKAESAASSCHVETGSRIPVCGH
jgi:uncharacterized protein RhaS with RHS repeats